MNFTKTNKSKEYFRILILRIIGNFLILSSLFMIGKTFYQPAKEEVRYFVNQYFNKKYVVKTDKMTFKIDQNNNQPKGGLAKLLNVKPFEVLTPEYPEFSIVVPKIGANAKILPNIDPTDDKIYLEALKHGVAHAQGTVFPGEGGHIFLFAHSTDYIWNVSYYNAVFYLLYKLEKEDEVNIFYKGQRYVYRVTDKTVVDPSQVEYLTRKSNREFLTLQTCWPPGTTLKRLLIFAVRKSE
ncbi:hypothetical protein AUK04_02600 [Candidatus Roizmanbacteria bacterium CG2_30_33_16]|uniref:Sortase n=5 Tax=Candidatus Roizmaniibacteriota TaxID=1752723 RepID=A0A2M7E5J0_9BACT|nr:sortase [Candidatus Roizmanbacteria bacterium]OIP84162.1 MAG: hypothetical protein AUK04_02600 [Candidatus Roizmanbacteria bacterium CG2_30_33_16]PIP64201.1 MAG: hypothetical protein COW96_03855 [Candidatus Roizmanbacteria bacterium CG22_combo_CG10-13_8_21_14_all_33_16]PIV63002.1 MAG: hypothetical protein COS12_00230 [Candidatus Roizmanbacteria bacterium CG01_land_8_20_14_3_00_33_9]PIX74185.1 MAG: hypothetical protein COZ39_00860 [Candidatus Roizmanbacteria bacterium CG_4_10_14_3_um_filter_3